MSRYSDGLDGRGLIPDMGKTFLHGVQTGSGAPPASYSTGTGVDSPVVRRQGREAHRLLPSSAEVKTGEAIPPLRHISSWKSA
jgi:hypothetical protein